MPQNALNMFRLEQLGSEKHGNAANPSRHLARHSLEANILYDNEASHEDMASGSPGRPTSLQSSYSTNELPTPKGNGFSNAISSPKIHPDQFQQHNTNFVRISTNAANNRQNKDSPKRDEAKLPTTQPQQTTLQASAAPFGPSAASSTNITGSVTPVGLATLHTPFYGYGLQAYMGSPAPANAQLQNYNASSPYAGYGAYGNLRYTDSTNRGASSRRNGEAESPQVSRFSNFPLEHYKGELYSLCKDQHGCRYLQRKLEEQNAEHVQIIFSETHRHVIELMTGLLSPGPIRYLVHDNVANSS